MVTKQGIAMSGLTPMPGRVLVELGATYENIVAPTKVYEGKSNGIVRALPEPVEFDRDKDLLGKRVYWQEFKEGSTITVGDKEYVFIKIEELDGYKSSTD